MILSSPAPRIALTIIVCWPGSWPVSLGLLLLLLVGPLRHVVSEVLRPLSNEVAKPVDEGSYAETEPRRNQVKKETKRLKNI